jgi:4-aminobutyrate aminotransferase/diaminobutyrate-pyruvate transaminase/4-aminobutyrate aminotransferase/(S)-3-amino-2-methylpropionate transaminase
MAGARFPLEPQDVPKVQTKHRRIVTAIPAPGSVPFIEKLRQYEPRSMGGQPVVLWDRAQGIHVFDRFGNQWLDWSSGVLVTNAGHNHPKVKQAIIDQVNHGLIHNYCFPSERRAELTEALAKVAPHGLDKVFLLTTGAEATECAIKLARSYGLQKHGSKKIGLVTYGGAFHGRTLGAQMAGGIPSLKQWIINLDKDITQVSFPDGFRNKHTGFDSFLRNLHELGVTPDRIAGVMTETYQGGDSSFAPPQYIQNLRSWCDEHDILLIMDEVQAGFGRTGKFWGFEHYGITPDLIACGKGISSGLPLSAVIGRSDVMDLYPPGSMTSTHTGNPVCAAAALASLKAIQDEGMVENARRMGQVLQPGLRAIAAKHPRIIGAAHGLGLVGSLHIVNSGPDNIDPDSDRAADIVKRCIEKGLMLFAPVGFSGACVKVSPPLCIPEDAVREGLAVLEEAVGEAGG